MQDQRVYLGDGVYVETERDGTVVVVTSNGERDTNTIYLEPEVLAALTAYLGRKR